MRHRREVGDDRIAGDILAEDQRQRHVLVFERLAADQLGQADRLALRVGQLDADHASAGDGRDAGRQRRHVAGDVVGKLDDPARLDAARRLQLVHGDDRAGPDLDDLAADVEILEHRFEQPRIALQPGAVDLLLALLGRRREQVERRQLVIVAERQARLGAAVFGPAARSPRQRSGRFGDGDGGPRLRRRGGRRRGRRAISVVRGAARALRGCAADRPASQPRSSSAESEREKPSDQAGEREQEQHGQAHRPGELRIGDEVDCGVDSVRARKPERAAPAARQSGNRRTAGQAERDRRSGPRRRPRSAVRGRSARPARSRTMRRPASAITGRNSDRSEPEKQQQRSRSHRRRRSPASWSADRRRRCFSDGSLELWLASASAQASATPMSSTPIVRTASAAPHRAARRASRAPDRAWVRGLQRSPSSTPNSYAARIPTRTRGQGRHCERSEAIRKRAGCFAIRSSQ